MFSEKKRVEKLRYMHRNPVKRGLVLKPEQWNWSSYRQYALGEQGSVPVNQLQKAELRVRIVPTRRTPRRVGQPFLGDAC